MAEPRLRLDAALGHVSGPAPASLMEGLNTDGAPLALQHDPVLASLPPLPPAPPPEFDWGQALESLQGALSDAVPLLQCLLLLYFVALNGGYLLLNLGSLFLLRLYLREQGAAARLQNGAPDEMPISIIMPAGEDEAIAVARVRAMLQLDYSEFEIIIVNDSPRDQVRNTLTREFSLTPFPEVYRDRIPCSHVKGVLASTVYPGLRLVDKENGGRADALNAALNCARYPLFCNLDTGFILQRDSLRKMGRPFQDDAHVVAACASIGVANGCTLHGGFMDGIGLPRSWPALFQAVEKLRGARLARMFWSRLNALLLTSEAFAMFHKETVLAAGGYRADVVNEDMELVARIHRLLRQGNKRYRIVHVPGPVCWADAPESWKALKSLCIKRQIGLMQSLEMNRQMLLGGRSGAVGWLGFPFVLLFEGLGPWLEVLGYVAMTLLWLSGLISFQAFWTFLLAVIGLGMLLSTSALLLDELAFHCKRKLAHTLKLFAVALLENLGYRQMTALWRLLGRQRWILHNKAK